MGRKEEAMLMQDIQDISPSDIAEMEISKGSPDVQCFLGIIEELRTGIINLGFREEDSIVAMIEIFFHSGVEWDMQNDEN